MYDIMRTSVKFVFIKLWFYDESCYIYKESFTGFVKVTNCPFLIGRWEKKEMKTADHP